MLFGSGDGTLAPAVSYPTGAFPGAVVLVDLDRDGLLDAVTCNRGSNDLTIYYGAADGSLHSPLSIGTSHYPVDLAFGDFDGDLDPDLVVAAQGQGPLPASLDLYANRGDGTFHAREQIAPIAAAQLQVADFDQDGALDLALAAGSARLLLGRGNGQFHAPAPFTAGQATVQSLAVGDLTGDGWLDLVAGNQDQKAAVLINRGAP